MGFGHNRNKLLFMTHIRDFMAHDHLLCDGAFERAGQVASAGNWGEAATAFSQFRSRTSQHFDAEEAVLFPAFEEATGMRMGPTQVMRSEHVQMRQLLEALSAALAERDSEDYAGYAETLLIMLQQHNLKEENMLYPLCDQHLVGQTSTLLAQLREQLPGQET